MRITPLLQLAATSLPSATNTNTTTTTTTTTSAATDWSFTFYAAEGCSGESAPVAVNGTGDVECAAVPGGGRVFGSVLGAIPAGGCAVHLFTDEGCGSRLAYGLTDKTDHRCMSLADDAAVPLRSYQALSCG